MNILAIFFALIGRASLSIFAKLGTQDFVEKVLTDVLIYAGDKLAAYTTNELDNNIMRVVKEKLGRSTTGDNQK